MKTVSKNQAIKEAKTLYSGGKITDWTQNEFVNDYLNALRADGYKLV